MKSITIGDRVCLRPHPFLRFTGRRDGTVQSFAPILGALVVRLDDPAILVGIIHDPPDPLILRDVLVRRREIEERPVVGPAHGRRFVALIGDAKGASDADSR